MRLLALIFTMLVGATVSASILPRDQAERLRNPSDDPNITAQIDEKQFNEIIDHVIEMWEPIAKLHGAKLEVEKKWKDNTVNAYASQRGNIWSVAMFGGLARRPEVTPDGFALVVCHELGHHFGGHYFYDREAWASAEGQADYFATQVCGRRVFSRKQFWGYNRWLAANQPPPPYVKERCDRVWDGKAGEQEVCYRQAAAGLSLANLLAAAGGQPAMPKFETPDTRKVPRSNTAHPRAQCRLDTYFSGALCPVAFDLKVIPAKDMGPGKNNSAEAEVVAAQFSCFANKGFKVGYRPECWFKPQNTVADYMRIYGADRIPVEVPHRRLPSSF